MFVWMCLYIYIYIYIYTHIYISTYICNIYLVAFCIFRCNWAVAWLAVETSRTLALRALMAGHVYMYVCMYYVYIEVNQPAICLGRTDCMCTCMNLLTLIHWLYVCLYTCMYECINHTRVRVCFVIMCESTCVHFCMLTSRHQRIISHNLVKPGLCT